VVNNYEFSPSLQTSFLLGLRYDHFILFFHITRLPTYTVIHLFPAMGTEKLFGHKVKAFHSGWGHFDSTTIKKRYQKLGLKNRCPQETIIFGAFLPLTPPFLLP